MRAVLAVGQGVYFFVTGVWPLVSMRTFEAVTGPKTDKWLVKTVGVLVGVVGLVLISAGRRREVTRESALLAAGSAAGLGAIDTIYATRGRISKIYLLDAVVEAILVAAWAAAWATIKGSRRARTDFRTTGSPRSRRRLADLVATAVGWGS